MFRVPPRRESGASYTGDGASGQALLLIAGMLAIVYAIKTGLPPGLVLLFLGAGLFLLAAFARQQMRSDAPMLDLSLFARPAISAGLIMPLVASGAPARVELPLAQELQYVIGKTPLGITIFGVFTSSVFSRTINVPQSLTSSLAEQASRSIGDAYLVASQLTEEEGSALIEAGKIAFSAAHVALLTSAAAGIAALAVAVYVLLAHYRPSGTAQH